MITSYYILIVCNINLSKRRCHSVGKGNDRYAWSRIDLFILHLLSFLRGRSFFMDITCASFICECNDQGQVLIRLCRITQKLPRRNFYGHRQAFRNLEPYLDLPLCFFLMKARTLSKQKKKKTADSVYKCQSNNATK